MLNKKIGVKLQGERCNNFRQNERIIIPRWNTKYLLYKNNIKLSTQNYWVENYGFYWTTWRLFYVKWKKYQQIHTVRRAEVANI